MKIKVRVLHMEFCGCIECPFSIRRDEGGRWCTRSERIVNGQDLIESPDWCTLPIREIEERLE